MKNHEDVLAIVEELKKLYPEGLCSLQYPKPYELLFSVRLAAQCTDERVNMVTPALFARFPTLESLAQADPAEVETYIHSTGFFRAKARDIVAASRMLVEQYGGRVPDTMEELVTLPGVGRKTANVVLGNAFDMPGFPVDTHVIRVTGRLRWRDDWNDPTPDPVRIEREITACFPPEEWTDLSHRLILHGRATCHARKPDCGACPLNDTCPSAH